MSFISGGSAYARYARNTQTQANTNNCSNESNCAITSPQTQGDGSASSPTNVQVSRPNESQGQIGVGQQICRDCNARIFEGSIEVKTLVECPHDFEEGCPFPGEFIQFMRISQRDFAVFPSSFEGVPFECRFGFDCPAFKFITTLDFSDPMISFNYSVAQAPPPTPVGLTLVQHPSADCQGTMHSFDFKHCVITNEYIS